MTKDVITLLKTADPTTGAGASVDLGKPARTYAVEIEWSVSAVDKAITALVVAFEGSLTGTKFQAMDTAITLSAPELTAKYALRYIVDKPTQFMRANPTTVTITGTTGVITLIIKVLPVR